MSPAIVPEAQSDHPARIVCPHCALLCDDIAPRPRADLGFTLERAVCPRASAALARVPPAAEPVIAGRAATLEAAIAAAARLLKRARRPLFGGLATDVDGLRACVNLAERCGGVLDHLHGETLNGLARVQQSRGWYATTLAEVRNRADLVVVVDVDFKHQAPRFPVRCLGPRTALEHGAHAARHVVHLGPRLRGGLGYTPDEHLACARERVPEVLRALHARVAGHPLADRRPGGIPLARLDALAVRLREAAYGTLVFAPGTWGAAVEPVVGALADLVDALNTTTRAALLPLGGDDGAQAAVSTCSWLTGYPLRVAFGHTLHYEAEAHATAALLAADAVDVLVWIDAYGDHAAPPPAADPARTIVLAASRPPATSTAAVFIPVGTPGLDHFARLPRCDNVVTLPLQQQRDSGLPSVAGVLTRIVEKL